MAGLETVPRHNGRQQQLKEPPITMMMNHASQSRRIPSRSRGKLDAHHVRPPRRERPLMGQDSPVGAIINVMSNDAAEVESLAVTLPEELRETLYSGCLETLALD